MHDILRESPYYQEILQEGYQEGRQEGREEGKLEGQREALLAIVQFRFPKIARLSKRLVAANDDAASLQNLTVKISMAQTAEEAKQYMLEAVEENGN
jgi:predicted transposase YdaD